MQLSPVTAFLETGVVLGHVVAGPLESADALLGWTHLFRDEHDGSITPAVSWQLEARRPTR